MADPTLDGTKSHRSEQLIYTINISHRQFRPKPHFMAECLLGSSTARYQRDVTAMWPNLWHGS